MNRFCRKLACRFAVCKEFFITLALVLASMGFVQTSFGGINDKVLSFFTPGPDMYADGTRVADGECYALVWSPKGSTFAGFSADGTTVSSADRVVLAAPLAVDGRCRDSLFQIPAEEYAELADGVWAVCLVDTRMASGVPAGVAENAPRRVNRWGVVPGEVEITDAGSTRAVFAAARTRAKARPLFAESAQAAQSDAVEEEGSSAYVRADTLSRLPKSAKRPKITYFTVDGGVARLKVEDTEPYLTYGIASGESPSSLNSDGDAGIADGKPGAEIEFEADASGGSRFFKVVRAE